MEIQKILNLNKTPKDCLPGSIACAKNVRTDDTASFITNDIGFKEAFVCSNEGEYIVGVIPCNKEVVIFTYTPAEEGSGVSRIYRKQDSGEIKEPYTVWKWSGGKITGSYTYNYKGELIIAVGEYDAPVDVPLKTFNLDEIPFTSNTYATEENIPYYNASYSIINGRLVCGSYTFFVRFKVTNNDYTKWFQISSDINITQDVLSKKYMHTYLSGDMENPNRSQTVKEPFYVNSNSISSKGISVGISLGGDVIYSTFQLGYIVRHNSDVQGRIQGEYDCFRYKEISVIDNKFIAEISIDDLLENPHPMFNVKNVVTYNNRLYIANYTEHTNKNYTEQASQTIVGLVDDAGNEVSQGSNQAVVSGYRWTINLSMLQHAPRVPRDGFAKWDTAQINIKTDENNYVIEKDKFISYFTSRLRLRDSSCSKSYTFLGDYTDLNCFWFLQNSNTKSAICLAEHIGNSWGSSKVKDELGWDTDIHDYNIKIADNDILIEYNGVSYSLLAQESGTRSCIIASSTDARLNTEYYFGNGYSESSFDPSHKVGNLIPHDIHFYLMDTYSIPITSDEDEDGHKKGGISLDWDLANNRTLLPYQYYNFFVHYIRKDGSATLGFPILPMPVAYVHNTYGNVLIPKFTVKQPTDELGQPDNQYVGYFISYEDIDKNVDEVYIISANNRDPLVITNSKYLYDLDTIRGSKIIIDSEPHNVAIANMKFVENRLIENHVAIEGISTYTNRHAFLTQDVVNHYSNKTKTLYRLTNNIYSWDIPMSDNEYLPGFLTTNLIIYYTLSVGNNIGLVVNPAASIVTGFSNEDEHPTSKVVYNVNIDAAKVYCEYPMSAMSIKQDFQQAAVVLQQKISETKTNEDIVTNIVISPDKLHDFLELTVAYRSKPSKTYTNYDARYIDTFSKTVYRSDVFSDESLVNGFRHFGTNNYRNILENKGQITNIVGIGLYLIVHTEYSLFVFDRSPKLTQKLQSEIPDAFDVDYQEVMPSNEGFGGLRDKEESIITKHGYIWYDNTNKIIFSYENGQSAILSSDINNFLKYINVKTVRFAEDIIHSRLILCITTIDDNNNEKYITLSYNFNTKTFISLHDYKFTNNYRTYNKSYVFDNTEKNNTVLYEFDDDSIADYKGLTYLDGSYFPTYFTAGKVSESYVDIIFNTNYEQAKVLNKISYVLNRVLNKITPYNITEEYLNRRFSGNELLIYTDETNTGIMNIEVDKDNLNAIEAYNKPYYDKGKWNFNYFRDDIATGRDQSTGDYSDNRRLVYGKYFVVRFIFANDGLFKLDSLDISTDIY